MDRTEGLFLFSNGLLSKWGFEDGDEPNEVMDLLEAEHIDFIRLPWREIVLPELVRAHLLPALDQRVEVQDWDTCHNPIRAASVDGVEVPWEVLVGDGPEPTLTPEFVVVPWDAVLDACRRANTAPPLAPNVIL